MLAQMADLERGLRIKELRASRHLTQEAMADLLGVTLRGYQEWEAGGGIKWDNVKNLAGQLGVEPDYLMNGPKPETPDLLDGGAGGLGRQIAELDERVSQLADTINQLVNQLEATQVAQAVSRADAVTARRSSGPQRTSRAKETR